MIYTKKKLTTHYTFAECDSFAEKNICRIFDLKFEGCHRPQVLSESVPYSC